MKDCGFFKQCVFVATKPIFIIGLVPCCVCVLFYYVSNYVAMV